MKELQSLAMITIIILIILQIVNYFIDEDIIETRESMTNTFDYLTNVPGKFVLKDDDRYSTDRNFSPELQDPLLNSRKIGLTPMISPKTDIAGKSCGSMQDFPYRLNQSAGANNTYGDMIWSEMSPRNVLQDNCLNCNKFKPDHMYNDPVGFEPVGYESDVMSQPI